MNFYLSAIAYQGGLFCVLSAFFTTGIQMDSKISVWCKTASKTGHTHPQLRVHAIFVSRGNKNNIIMLVWNSPSIKML